MRTWQSSCYNGTITYVCMNVCSYVVDAASSGGVCAWNWTQRPLVVCVQKFVVSQKRASLCGKITTLNCPPKLGQCE